MASAYMRSKSSSRSRKLIGFRLGIFSLTEILSRCISSLTRETLSGFLFSTKSNNSSSSWVYVALPILRASFFSLLHSIFFVFNGLSAIRYFSQPRRGCIAPHLRMPERPVQRAIHLIHFGCQIASRRISLTALWHSRMKA